MEKNYFVTITGVNHYYGMKPFEVGRVIKLIKEPDNEFDSEAIRAELPFIDKIGYVANSPDTVAKGTFSAGRIYDLFQSEACAQILFITHSSVICLLLTPDEEKSEEDNRSELESGMTQEPKVQFDKAKMQIGFHA